MGIIINKYDMIISAWLYACATEKVILRTARSRKEAGQPWNLHLAALLEVYRRLNHMHVFCTTAQGGRAHCDEFCRQSQTQIEWTYQIWSSFATRVLALPFAFQLEKHVMKFLLICAQYMQSIDDITSACWHRFTDAGVRERISQHAFQRQGTALASDSQTEALQVRQLAQCGGNCPHSDVLQPIHMQLQPA
jgi:hypothetical protein